MKMALKPCDKRAIGSQTQQERPRDISKALYYATSEFM